jgi:hypothetical protein
VLLLALTFASAASAFQPQDALSARPAESIYTVLRLDDINGLLQYVFSQANVEMAASLLKPEQAKILNFVAALASQIPVNSAVVAGGIADMEPFVQFAASMPDSVRSQLDKVADGSATEVDILTLFLGEAGEMFAGILDMELQDGAKGPYYSLMGQAALAARDDLLLIAFPPTALDASIDALENQENRMSPKRRFDSPDYWQMHIDISTYAALAEALGDEDILRASDAMTEVFKAPVEIETAFEPKPGSFLMSVALNIMESVKDAERYEYAKPAVGGNLFLAGGGRLLLAFSSPLALSAADFKVQPKVAEAWDKIISALASMDISEGDVEDMLNGYFSAVFGSEAAVMGKDVPGGYIALTGREGTASKILGKLMNNEEFTQSASLIPLEAAGWESAFAVDPAVLPAPLVFGVMGDTLFAGVLNAGDLTKKPEIPAEVAKMLDEPLMGVGVIDTAAIWSRIGAEVADPNSLLSLVMGDAVQAFQGVMEYILGADLSVPLVKMWSSELETGFIEFSVADVPQDKRLLPRLVTLWQMFALQGEEEETDD